MVRFLKLVVIAPFAIILLIFAFANRHFVTVSFDPFTSGGVPAFAIEAPLFVVLILTAMLGVIAGGLATWFAQAKHRRAERQARAEAERWRAEAVRAQSLAPQGLPARP
jgi:uncharacterized integral membrane protein